jgi:hypothetical protein
VSEKYTTAELIDRICWKDDDRVLGPNDPYYPICEDTKDAIIARLRAAEVLASAAHVLVVGLAELRWAIADYEGVA